MLMHLLKLIWNRKKSNLLMISEIAVSFIIVFAMLSLVIFSIINFYKPIGFEYENVWALDLEESEDDGKENEDIVHQNRQYKKSIYEHLKTYPQIENISASNGNVPFVFNNSSGTALYEGNKAHADIFRKDHNYLALAKLKLIEGRWFEQTDDGNRLPPMVINKYVSDALFNNESAIGKTINFWGNDYHVVGVIEEYRQQGEYAAPGGSVFARINTNAPDFDYSKILIRVKPGTSVEFEEKMINDLHAIIPSSWSIEVFTLERAREIRKKFTRVPQSIAYSIGGFLILNVALGIFGVLWYNINRRISEIGLRRAVGSFASGIQMLIIGEVLVLASFGVIGGCLIAFQFPLLNVFNLSTEIYLLAILVSVIFIYSLAALCAWYPGWQASKIEPAMALHEE